MTAQLMAVIAPIVLSAAVGYGWARSRLDYPADFVRRVVMWVGTPCLVISTISRADVPPVTLLLSGAASLTVVTVTLVAFALLLTAAGMSRRVYLPPMIFPNTGNMGVPLCLFAFGEEGLALGLAFFVAMTFAHFTLGLVITAGIREYRQVLRSPIVWSALIAVTLLMTGTSLPLWLDNTMTLLGGLTIPLMLLTLGVSLASIRVQTIGRAFVLSALRLVGGLLAGVLVAWLFSLEGVARGVVILQAAMPAAVFNYMFALQQNRSPHDVAGVVVVSTLLSFLMLPPLLIWLLAG